MSHFYPLGLTASLALSRWPAANIGQFELTTDWSQIRRDLERLGISAKEALVSVTDCEQQLWSRHRDLRPRILWNLTPNTERQFAAQPRDWVTVAQDPWFESQSQTADLQTQWQGYGPVLVDGSSWTRATTARKIATRAEATIYLDHTFDEAVGLLGSRLR